MTAKDILYIQAACLRPTVLLWLSYTLPVLTVPTYLSPLPLFLLLTWPHLQDNAKMLLCLLSVYLVPALSLPLRITLFPDLIPVLRAIRAAAVQSVVAVNLKRTLRDAAVALGFRMVAEAFLVDSVSASVLYCGEFAHGGCWEFDGLEVVGMRRVLTCSTWRWR